MTVWLVRIWTYKNADEKAHTFSRSKNVKKRTKTYEKRILCKFTLRLLQILVLFIAYTVLLINNKKRTITKNKQLLYIYLNAGYSSTSITALLGVSSLLKIFGKSTI